MRSYESHAELGGAGIGGRLAPFADGLVALSLGVTAPAFAMVFDRNEEIYGEQEAADFVYKVISGVVRTYRMLNDGRRQIVAFYYAGDVFGLEAGELHSYCAEAVTECRIALTRRRGLERIANEDVAAARMLWGLAVRDAQRLGEHMLLLGRKGAVERVAGFLHQLVGHSPNGRLKLPMSRIDIADYLGLTIESVSRSMTRLERDGVIAMAGARNVEVRDRVALESYED